MSRDYYINGQCMVYVSGALGSNIGITAPKSVNGRVELGLTDGNGVVTIVPNYKHTDYEYDDFGKGAPPNISWLLADATITMTLVHFDSEILNACISESAGGGTAGTMKGAGLPMGAGKSLGDAKNHYIKLTLSTPLSYLSSWEFPASYLSVTPVSWPISAERSLVRCVWRAIPYVPIEVSPNNPNTVVDKDIKSLNAILWRNI